MKKRNLIIVGFIVCCFAYFQLDATTQDNLLPIPQGLERDTLAVDSISLNDTTYIKIMKGSNSIDRYKRYRQDSLGYSQDFTNKEKFDSTFIVRTIRAKAVEKK